MGGTIYDRRNITLEYWKKSVKRDCYEKGVYDWAMERGRAMPEGADIPEELELTQDDLDFLQNYDTVKRVLTEDDIM